MVNTAGWYQMKGLKVSGLLAKNIFSRGIFVKVSIAGKEKFRTNYGEPGANGVWESPGNWVMEGGLHIHCVHTCIIDACIVCTHACVMPGHRK